jgi:hypothetical protein
MRQSWRAVCRWRTWFRRKAWTTSVALLALAAVVAALTAPRNRMTLAAPSPTSRDRQLQAGHRSARHPVATTDWTVAGPRASGPAAAAHAVHKFIARHAQGCTGLAFHGLTAKPTRASEITDTRPAGYDVTVKVSGAVEPAEFLVGDGHVYPDDPVSGELALGCHKPPPVPRTALGWHALPYLNISAGVIQAGSDGAWPGAAVVKALPAITSQFPEGDSGAIWGQTCTAAAQEVRFDRELELPGRPDSLSFLLTAVIRGDDAGPLSDVVVLINGHQVFASAKGIYYAAAQLDATALAAVRFGANDVTVIVRKPVSGACNISGGDQYGVHFTIAGRFHADAVGASLPGTGLVSCQATVCNGQATIPFTVSNDGPAEMLEPRFDAIFTFADRDEVDRPYFSAVQSGLTGVRCHFNRIGPYKDHIFCDWSPFAPNARGTLELKFPYQLTRASKSAPVTQAWTVTWSFPGAYGSPSQDAGGTVPLIACAPVSATCPVPIS